METTEELREKFIKAKNDEERWRLVLDHKDRFELWLDNDETGVVVDGSDHPSLYFDDYVGWHTGVCILLGVIGVKADPV